jgi:hypothetical protein
LLQIQDSPPLIPGDFDSFAADELRNIYVLKGDELKLYRPDGELWIRNSLKTMGAITTMDVFYSLKPMLYSEQMQQVLVLDNTLSVQGDVISLNRRGFAQASLVAVSVQNHFWVFDKLEMELTRVDRQWNRTATSGRLDQLLGITPEPIEIVEFDNWVYVNDPKNGVLVFDLFGTYSKTIPIMNASNIQVRKNTIYYLKDSALWRYDRVHFRMDQVMTTPTGLLDFSIGKERILYLTEQGIHRIAREDLNNK